MKSDPAYCLRIQARESEDFESWQLGELFCRRTNSVGYKVNQPLSTRIDLKFLNRLSQGGGPVEVPASELTQFARSLLQALEHSTHRWYWFENGDERPPRGWTEVRVDSIQGPNYDAFAGFEECQILLPDDQSEAWEKDLKSRDGIETDEGYIRVRSENAHEHYRAELDRLLAFAANPAGPTFAVRLDSGRPPRAPNEFLWKSFDRARFPNKARTHSTVLRTVLGPRLTKEGFRERRGVAGCLWVRDTGQQCDILQVDRSWSAPRLRVFLGINAVPGVYGGAAIDPQRPKGFTCELLASEAGRSKGKADFEYSNQETLEAVYEDVWRHLMRTGVEWFRDPLQKSRAEWIQDGILHQDGEGGTAIRVRVTAAWPSDMLLNERIVKALAVFESFKGMTALQLHPLLEKASSLDLGILSITDATALKRRAEAEGFRIAFGPPEK